MEQGTLGDFENTRSKESRGGDGARPAAEAEAVAGSDDGSASVVDVADYEFPDADGHLECAVTQVDYTIEGTGDDEHPVLHVFGRRPTDGDDEPVHVRVYGFKPYFYTPLSELDIANSAEPPLTEADVVDSRLDHDRLTGLETEDDSDNSPEKLAVYESIRGEKLVKVFGQTPRDVGQLRDRFEHYEADILFPNRLLIDKDITSGVRVPKRTLDDGSLKVHHSELTAAEVDAESRLHVLDIEVEDRHGFPEDGEQEIVCLTSYDSYRDEYVIWLAASDDGVDGPDALDGYDPIGETALDVDVRRFDDEATMLVDYLDYIEATAPDILSGWNFDDFDAPYLIDRIDRIEGRHDRLYSDRLSRVREVWDSGWGGPNIKGRVVFDLLYAYQRTQFSELDSYRLDAVGEEELGVGKERYPGDIGDLWEDDPERLLEYNLRDVELCVELNRKQNIVEFWEEVASFVGCKLEDATTPGDAVDMYVLHKIHGEFALPSKGQQESEEYEGGAVFDPISGVKEMVSVLDLKCFSGDTDVATPEGVRNIQDIAAGDPVYTLKPETFECEIKPVVDTQTFQNTYGELHHVSGETHDFKVTENHRFLLSDTRGGDSLDPDDYELSEYRELPEHERLAFPDHEPMAGATRQKFDLAGAVEEGYVAVYARDDPTAFRAAMPGGVEAALDGASGHSQLAVAGEKTGAYHIPVDTYREQQDAIDEHADKVFLTHERGHSEIPTTFEMDDWLELVGRFVTGGRFTSETEEIVFEQRDGEGCEAIRNLLERLGLPYNADGARVTVTNRFLYDWFVTNCGDDATEARLPGWVFELDADHLRTLLETLVGGDGGLGTFRTESGRLKDDVVRLAVRCGEKPTVSKRSDGTWHVAVGKRGAMKKSHATVEDHDGTVHCITAEDNHVVLAGRNGHLQWVGQSLYPMCMVTINASPETKVNPDDYGGETYAAPNGTHFRKEPDGVIREMVDELLEEREEKKGLRNEHDPNTDAYETYDRQQAAVKVIMNCFTPDTDVLTPGGIRNIRDLGIGDEVYSLNPETMEMEVKPVVDTHAYPDYRGELVDLRATNVDFRVTPNHRMLVRESEPAGTTEDEYRFVEAGNLDRTTGYELPHGWDGPDGDELTEIALTERIDGAYEVWVQPEVNGRTFTSELGWEPQTVPNADVGENGYVFTADEFEQHRAYVESVCAKSYVRREPGDKWIPRTYDGDDFLELLAWYVSEGSVDTSGKAEGTEQRRGDSTTVQITRKAVAADGGNTHTTASALLDRMGFNYDDNDRSYQFTSELLGDLLCTLVGDGSEGKRLPQLVFEAPRRQKERVLRTLVSSGGDRQPDSWQYRTASKRLRDDVLRLCAHLGRTARYSEDDDGYRVFATENSENTLRADHSVERTTADDGVYCVTVKDNHTLLAGREGTFQFVGQSLYGVLGWDRFRLYDKEMGAAVTATGRDVIEFTEQAAAELDKDVIYGDTDSVMLELGSGTSRAEAIDQSFEIESHINDAYDRFAERLNAEEHRFQIEFEKLYRRFFQAGKKKRYAGHIVWKEGKEVDDLDITGFEYQRSDIAPITKEVQREVLEMIVTGEDPEDIKTYVHDIIERVREGDISHEELAIPGGIGKKLDNYETDTAQVRGAKYANLLLGTNFTSGSKPKRLYLKKVHPSFFRTMESEKGLDPSTDQLYGEFKREAEGGEAVICFEYEDQVPDAFEVDYEKMLDKTLKGPIARVLEALDISWDEVESGQEQTGLGNFM